MTDKEAPYLLHCTNTRLHQDIFNTLPVLLRIRLFNTSLLEPPKNATEDNLSTNTVTDARADTFETPRRTTRSTNSTDSSDQQSPQFDDYMAPCLLESPCNTPVKSSPIHSSSNDADVERRGRATRRTNRSQQRRKHSSSSKTSRRNDNTGEISSTLSSCPSITPSKQVNGSLHGSTSHQSGECSKSYTPASRLTKHKRVHTNKTRFECDVCQKMFARSDYLSVHKQIHDNIKPHKCDVCPKTFTTSGNLLQHKRVHTGETQYRCDVCLKTFRQSSNLVSHKRVHTGETPYSCDVC